MPLTPTERQSFTAAKLAVLDRMAPRRMDESLEPPVREGELVRTPEQVATTRAKCVGQWANMSVPELRARVNLLRYNGATPIFAPESDYSVDEQNAVTWASGPDTHGRTKEAVRAIQRATELKSELDADLAMPARTKAALIKAVMQAR